MSRVSKTKLSRVVTFWERAGEAVQGTKEKRLQDVVHVNINDHEYFLSTIGTSVEKMRRSRMFSPVPLPSVFRPIRVVNYFSPTDVK